MPAYGRYEVLGDLYPGSAGNVLQARAPGEAFSVVVKTIAPPRAVFAKAAVDRQIESFVARAKTQQRVSTISGSGWAPILDCGRADDEGFYVTHLYPQSVSTLLDGHVRVPVAALYIIVDGIERGLSQLRATCNRSHGNLKPTNVLIDRRDRLHQAGVVLTDLATDERAQQAGERHDLDALGHLIHELVIGSEAAAGEDLTGPAHRDWSRLGPGAQQWRSLTRRLIYTGADVLSLETLRGALAEVRPTKKRRNGLMVGALICAAALGAAVLWSMNRGKTIDPKAFSDTVAIYEDRYQRLVEAPTNKDKTGHCLKVLRSDLYDSLKAIPTPEQVKGLGTVTAVQRELQQLDKLQNQMNAPSALYSQISADSVAPGLSQCPRLRQVFTDMLAQLDECDPTRAKTVIPAEIVKQVDPLRARADAAHGEHELLTSVASALVEDNVTSADEKLSELFGWGLSNPSVLDHQLAGIRDREKQIREQGQKDPVWMKNFAQELTRQWSPLLGGDDFNTKEDDARLAAQLDPNTDPRARLGPALQAKLTEMGEVAKQPNVAKLFADFQEHNVRHKDNYPWNLAQADLITKFANLQSEWLSKLDLKNPDNGDDVKNYVTHVDSFDEISAGRKSAWTAQWGKLRPLPNQTPSLQLLTTSVENLKKLVSADGPSISWPADLPPNDALAKALSAAADKVFSRLLETENFQPPFNSVDNQLVVDRNKAAADATAFVTALSAVLRDIKSDAAPGQIQADLDAPALRRLMADPSDEGKDISTIAEKAYGLGQIRQVLMLTATESLRRQLQASSDATPAEVELIAWRRLGTDASWPADDKDRTLDQKTYATLIKSYPTTDQTAPGTLAGENKLLLVRLLQSETLRAERYTSVAAQNADGIELGEAKAWVMSLIGQNQKLPDAVAYNFAVLDLKHACETTSDETKLKALIDTFERSRHQKDDRLHPLAAGSVGPSKPGWEMEVGRQTQTFTHQNRNAANLRIGFIKLSSGYLMSGEVSVRLFNQILIDAGAQGWPKMVGKQNLLVPNAPALLDWTANYSDPKHVITSIARAKAWLPFSPKPGYDDYIKVLGSVPDDPPMHFVSPLAAKYVAGLIGCRLPTEKEWQEACTKDKRTADNFARPGDNLRDRDWLATVQASNSTISALAVDNVKSSSTNEIKNLLYISFAAPSNDSSNLVADNEQSLIYPWNDGSPFFRSVDNNPDRFHDLVGNVAEYVTDESRTQVGIIGGSALSPNSKQFPVDQISKVTDNSSSGFSDVGFRLMFDTGDNNPIQQLKNAVAKLPFDLGKPAVPWPPQ